MDLNDTQKQAIAKWAAEGLSIGDIQKKLAEEFKVSMTYMDLRFLLIDLGAELKDKEKRKAAPTDDLKKPAAASAPGADAQFEEEGVADALGGGISVEIDRIMKPGALVSGTVKFSDGVTAKWMLDQMGRLALDASQKGYRPSDQDIQAFQVEISSQLQKRGF